MLVPKKRFDEARLGAHLERAEAGSRIMDLVELLILVSALSHGREALLPGEQMPLRDYLARLLGEESMERWRVALRSGEFTVWVESHAVTDLDRFVLVRPDTQFAVAPGRADLSRPVTTADALNCRRN